MKPTISQVCTYLEEIAPLAQQESYDNAGLLVGDAGAEVKGVLCCLDITEGVLAEALETGCNLVVAHHPIIFGGLKRLTGSTYVERCVAMALREGLAIYAIHTNLDNALYRGVNAAIAERLGLQNTRILAPHPERLRVQIWVPAGLDSSAVEQVLQPYAPIWKSEKTRHGEKGYLWEASLSISRKGALSSAFRSASVRGWQVEPGFEITFLRLEEEDPHCGAGMLGELPEALAPEAFLDFLKKRMQTGCIRHTYLPKGSIKKVALCGGAGSFLLKKALTAGADVFISGDFKYHEFFEADGKILIADIGHYESEQFTINLLCELLSEKFVTFAARCTRVRTNPVFYF